eukprot:snap_masked-scaffold_2-processed-gene-25.16-mRNA-1 protein AED:1.00 eAED:1.00 QI:0/-1/0/0/-1/1/1/0/62
MISDPETVESLLAAVEVELYGEFPKICLNNDLIKPELTRVREKGRDSDDTNPQILMSTEQRC